MDVEPFEKRFGMIAVGKGIITMAHVLSALKIQVDDEIKKGKRRLIGEILVEQGFLSQKQVQEVVQSIL